MKSSGDMQKVTANFCGNNILNKDSVRNYNGPIIKYIGPCTFYSEIMQLLRQLIYFLMNSQSYWNHVAKTMYCAYIYIIYMIKLYR